MRIKLYIWSFLQKNNRSFKTLKNSQLLLIYETVLMYNFDILAIRAKGLPSLAFLYEVPSPPHCSLHRKQYDSRPNLLSPEFSPHSTVQPRCQARCQQLSVFQPHRAEKAAHIGCRRQAGHEIFCPTDYGIHLVQSRHIGNVLMVVLARS